MPPRRGEPWWHPLADLVVKGRLDVFQGTLDVRVLDGGGRGFRPHPVPGKGGPDGKRLQTGCHN
jgi:hypothetical protein